MILWPQKIAGHIVLRVKIISIETSCQLVCWYIVDISYVNLWNYIMSILNGFYDKTLQ